MTAEADTEPRRCRIVAVTNQKGGVGKTTTVVNVGAALAASGFRCLVLDMDPQGNASTGLGSFSAERGATSYDIMTGSVPISDAIVSTAVEGLDLVPGSTDLSGLDAELMQSDQRADRLRAVLDPGAPDSIGRNDAD